MNNHVHQELTIRLLDDTSAVSDFAQEAWETLYGDKQPSLVVWNSENFIASYSRPNGRLLLASLPDVRMAGIIAYTTYVDRFNNPTLKFPRDKRVAEVGKLFVAPSCRRMGIASRLIQELVDVAREEDEIDVLYLHTHPFLPGAQVLWEKEGWKVLLKDDREPWYTIHMQRDLQDPTGNSQSQGP